MLRLPQFCCVKYVAMELTRGNEKRVMSPSGGSTLMTSAPMSASIRPQCGPESTRGEVEHAHAVEGTRAPGGPAPPVATVVIEPD